MKQTKIVCTISDFRCDEEFLRKLFNAGMNVIRMNTAHGTPDGMAQVIKNARAVSPHIGLLIDTKGPEIRTTGVKEPINYNEGDVVKVFGRPEMDSSHDIINVSYQDITRDVNRGDRLLIDDGALALTVMENTGPMLVARVENAGVLDGHKSVNIPGVHVNLPALTEKDISNINFAIDHDIDFIAHSFVRSADDVKAVKIMLNARHADIKVISKIENQEGVDNIDEIIDESYGIMIARGDLGIEIPMEEIPSIQRMIIRKCIEKKKPVIVATQLLHTMIRNPRPTRAEVADIANAVFAGTDALMLSGETASGKYPVECVETMSRIAEQAENDRQAQQNTATSVAVGCTQKEFLAHAAIESTEKLGVKGIITVSVSGETARELAAFRGPTPILAICYYEKAQRWLNLSYGIIPVYPKEHASEKRLFLAAIRMLRQKGYLDDDDKIALLSGTLTEDGGTSSVEIHKVSKLFESGYRYHLPKKYSAN